MLDSQYPVYLGRMGISLSTIITAMKMGSCLVMGRDKHRGKVVSIAPTGTSGMEWIVTLRTHGGVDVPVYWHETRSPAPIVVNSSRSKNSLRNRFKNR